MSAGRILVVDDEPQIRRIMRTSLTGAGYEVDDAKSGEEALEKVRAFRPDLILLDINMPGMGGLAACRAIRGDANVAIIMLTVRNTEASKVEALDAGADDYVTKPFSSEELLARVRAALRRSDTGTLAGVIKRGDLVIDVDRRKIVRGGDELRLTPKELELLLFLAQHAGRVLTHRTILKAIWGPNAVDQPEHLRVLVNSLRRKLERDPSNPQYIKTEPWVGYRFAEE